jgi:cell fate regulator YaaT (PSP1 superfamily)
MTDTDSLYVAAVKFKWQKDEKTYDYFIPTTLTVNVGDKVVVETKRGETKVEVMEIKSSSDKAQKAILRVVEDLRTDEERQAKHSNGQPMFSEDRTMLDEKGNRAIFDDVDR